MATKTVDPLPLKIAADFYEWDRIAQVRDLAEQVLQAKKADDASKAMSSAHLYDIIEKSFPAHNIPRTTFIVTLSTLVKSKDSKINCLGRKQGYYLVNKLNDATGSEDIGAEELIEEELKGKKSEKEKRLYAIFADWLFTQGFGQVKDTSNARNHDLGTWGNPDITGIKIHETLGKTTDIEFATIEVKLGMKGWKYWIFESVAHKRFANRTYFAFAHSEKYLNKIDPDLKHYAELYGIGILILSVDDSTFEKLNGEKWSYEIEEDYTSTDVIEYASAHYQRTNYHFRGRFLKSLGIGSDSELHKWGQKIQ